MKQVQYKCDQCQKIVGANHLSFFIDPRQTGLAVIKGQPLVVSEKDWQLLPFLNQQANSYQFCNTDCFTDFFKRKYADAMMKQLKK